MSRAVRAVLLTTGSLVALAGGYGAWRLRQAPISLDWLRPYVENHVNAATPEQTVSMRRLTLAWSSERHRLELRAIDVHVRLDELGQELTLPAVAIYPRWWPLLRGQVELHHLALIGPRLALVRTAQGITLGATPSPAPPGVTGTPALTTTILLENLHELLAVVGFIELQDGEISIDDRDLAHTWSASQVHGRLAVLDGRLDAHLKAQVHSNALVAGVALAATEIAQGGIEIALNVDDVVPATVLDAFPPGSRFKPSPALENALAMVTAPVSIESRLRLRAPGAIDGPIVVNATSNAFALTGAGNGLRLRDGKLDLAVEIAPSIDSAQIRDSTITFADGGLTLDGTLTRSGSKSRIEIHAAVERFALAALRYYWPDTAAPAARRWVTENIAAGVVKDASATLDVVYGSSVGPLRIDAKASFDGVSVRFAPTMPPASGLAGSVSFAAGETVFTVERGRLDELHVTGGQVRIVPSQPATPTNVVVDADVRGPLARARAVLDHEPVGLGRRLSFPPDDVEGTVEANVHVTVPLGSESGQTLAYGGSARLQGVALRQPINGWPIGAGDFDLRVADGTITADGKAAVAGVPASMNLHYDLAGTAPSTIRVQAVLDAPARTALGIDLGDMVSGTIPISVTMTPRRNAPTVIAVDADLTAAQFTPPVAAFGKSAGHAGRASAQLTLAPDASLHIDRFDIDAGGTVANGSAVRARDGWQTLRANLRVPVASTQSGSGAAVDLSAERQSDGFAVSLRSSNAGAVLNHLLTGEARGGTLRLDGTVRPSNENTTMNGRLDIQDVHFDSAPMIARVVTLGSLSGLKSTMRSQGVHFDQIQGELDYKKGIVHIADGRADGDAMMILVSGSLDPSARRMDLRTHLIPSYYGLNRAPQRIPVFGKLVEKATGEAVQVIDARVHGSFDDPSVTMAPASMVAPKIVKDQIRSWKDRVRGKDEAR